MVFFFLYCIAEIHGLRQAGRLAIYVALQERTAARESSTVPTSTTASRSKITGSIKILRRKNTFKNHLH